MSAFSVHLAVSVRSSLMGVLKSNVSSFSVNQPIKTYPSRVGASGSLAFSLAAIICSSTAEPPALSNLTVYVVLSSAAYAILDIGNMLNTMTKANM